MLSQATCTTGVAQVANPTGGAQYFYVVTDGTLSVYDIANDHTLVKQVPIPIAGKHGVMAAPAQGLLYITERGSGCGGANGSLPAYNLLTDQVAWIANYSFRTDQRAITPDGRAIYMPHGADASDGSTTILDASDGQPIGRIEMTTLQVVVHLPTLTNTHITLEVDWVNRRLSTTSTRFGLGRVTG